MENFFMSLKSFKSFKIFKIPNSKELAMKCRTLVRDWIVIHISDQIYLVVSIGFFFFIFGFSISLKLKYKEQFVSYILKCHLPGLGPFYQKISWETYYCVLPIQKQLLHLSQIDFYSHSMLLKSNKEWLNIIHQNYSGTSNFNAAPFQLFARKYIKSWKNTCLPLAGSITFTNVKNRNPLLTKNFKYHRHGSYPIRSLKNRIVTKSYGSAKWIHKFYTSLDDIPFKLQSVGTRRILHSPEKIVTAFVHTLEKSIPRKQRKAKFHHMAKNFEEYLQLYSDLDISKLKASESNQYINGRLQSGYIYPDLTREEIKALIIQQSSQNFFLLKSFFPFHGEIYEFFSEQEVSIPPSFSEQALSYLFPTFHSTMPPVKVGYRSMLLESFENLDTEKLDANNIDTENVNTSDSQLNQPEQNAYHLYRPPPVWRDLSSSDAFTFNLYRGPAVWRDLLSNDAITFNVNDSKNDPKWRFKNPIEWWGVV